MSYMMKTVAAATVISVSISGAVLAADFNEKFEGVKPAVSGFNGKLDLGYTYLDLGGTSPHYNSFTGIGSISAPLGQSFGVQFDAGLGRISNSGGSANAAGIGSHLFWRNPDSGLIGAYGHYVRLSGGGASLSTVRLGAEAEAYIDQISLEGFVGADITRFSAGGHKSTASLDFTAAYYFTDNFRAQAGISHSFDKTLGKLGMEAMLPLAANNVALYADGAFGSHITKISTGVRIYFGESGKSLKARHREDDPKARLFDLYAISGLAPAAGVTPPPPPPGGCETGFHPTEGCGCQPDVAPE